MCFLSNKVDYEGFWRLHGCCDQIFQKWLLWSKIPKIAPAIKYLWNGSNIPKIAAAIKYCKNYCCDELFQKLLLWSNIPKRAFTVKYSKENLTFPTCLLKSTIFHTFLLRSTFEITISFGSEILTMKIWAK